MHYKESQSREQIMMLSYDSMIAQDNPVRLIDLMCRKFVSDNPVQDNWKGNNKTGRKSYPPSSMLALLVYGYFNGLSSSRKLETETHRNIELLWLMECLQPDHWTICEFRRNNELLFREFLKVFRKFLLDQEYASGKRIIIDGSKVKAYACRDMLNSEGIRKKLDNLDKSISQYMSQLEKGDLQEEQIEESTQKIAELKTQIKKLKKRKAKLESAGQALKASGKKHIAPNDTDAVLVKGRDGKFAGYNAQISVESKGHFIMSGEVTTHAVDQQQLKNSVETAIEETGEVPREVIADKGYGNVKQIFEIESHGPQCYVPLEITSREKEEKKGLFFEYQEQNDTYICPQGKILQLQAKEKKQRASVYYVYKCYECDGCPIRQKCTTSKTGRVYKRNTDQSRIGQYKQKLSSEYAKARINERKTIVEHPFGTIKWLMGKFNFLLTGKVKTQIEFDLYQTAYNIKRIISYGKMDQLKTQMMNYTWSMY